MRTIQALESTRWLGDLRFDAVGGITLRSRDLGDIGCGNVIDFRGRLAITRNNVQRSDERTNYNCQSHPCYRDMKPRFRERTAPVVDIGHLNWQRQNHVSDATDNVLHEARHEVSCG